MFPKPQRMPPHARMNAHLPDQAERACACVEAIETSVNVQLVFPGKSARGTRPQRIGYGRPSTSCTCAAIQMHHYTGKTWSPTTFCRKIRFASNRRPKRCYGSVLRRAHRRAGTASHSDAGLAAAAPKERPGSANVRGAASSPVKHATAHEACFTGEDAFLR